MNEDFANCAKFHRRVKSALALGEYHDWEHFRNFEGEIIQRLCDLEFRSWLYLFSCFLFSYFLFSIHLFSCCFSLFLFRCSEIGVALLVGIVSGIRNRARLASMRSGFAWGRQFRQFGQGGAPNITATITSITRG